MALAVRLLLLLLFILMISMLLIDITFKISKHFAQNTLQRTALLPEVQKELGTLQSDAISLTAYITTGFDGAGSMPVADQASRVNLAQEKRECAFVCLREIKTDTNKIIY